jgi:glucose-6-phosphate dehydrogenase assembly protein OpcA
MNAHGDRPLLPSAAEVPFAEVELALARTLQAANRPRTLTATMVVIGPRDRLVEAAAVLQQLDAQAGLRAILITRDGNAPPAARLLDNIVVLEGLKSSYVNNAVAALRLSSLPTLVWWRGGDLETLDEVAALADRLVLDADDPVPGWGRVAALAERTAISDLRWTRLTRWRALMAHFFDIPEVRAIADGFDRAELAGADVHALRLFGGWLASSLPASSRLAVTVQQSSGGAPITRARLANGSQELVLRLAPSGTCVTTSADVEGHAGASSTVSIGDQGLLALVAEELRVRSRDLAFEGALCAAALGSADGN